MFPSYIDWATSVTGLHIREKHRGISKDFLEYEGRKLPPCDALRLVDLEGEAVKGAHGEFPDHE